MLHVIFRLKINIYINIQQLHMKIEIKIHTKYGRHTNTIQWKTIINIRCPVYKYNAIYINMRTQIQIHVQMQIPIHLSFHRNRVCSVRPNITHICGDRDHNIS